MENFCRFFAVLGLIAASHAQTDEPFTVTMTTQYTGTTQEITTVPTTESIIVTTTTETPETTTEALPTHMYGYGSAYQDFQVDCAGVAAEKHCWTEEIKIPNGVRLKGVDFYDLRINTNGFVEFGYDYLGRQSSAWDTLLDSAAQSQASDEGLAIITPLWVDNDQSTGSAKVWYHLYDKNDVYNENLATLTSSVLDRADQDAIDLAGFTTFSTSQVLVATWEDQLPRVWYDPAKDQENTYQMVLIVDSINFKSFVLFNFEQLGWDSTDYIRPSQGGLYVYKDGVTESFSSPVSNTGRAYTMTTGNTALYGVWQEVTSSGLDETNYGQLCYDWYYSGLDEIDSLNMKWANLTSCPCDLTMATNDLQWSYDSDQFAENGKTCYYLTTPVDQYSQECCYDTVSTALITTKEGRGGSAFLYSRFYAQNHVTYDVTPKEQCCELSSNCDLFYRLRPLDKCDDYTPPQLCWGYGDPHIVTLDALRYTFNGYGEYWLLQTTNGEFSLQGRTEQALDTDGNPTFATVYSAFAAAGPLTDKVSITMNSDRNGLNLYIDNVDTTSWFNGAADNEARSGDGVTLTKFSSEGISAFFTSGFSLNVIISNGLLDITVGAQNDYINKTLGLLGVFNDDPTDDLTTPTGEILDSTSSERTIYYQFGEQWKIQSQEDSLLYYEEGTSLYTYRSENFEPFFVDEVIANLTDAELAVVDQLCNNDTNCIFDYSITKSEAVGNSTKIYNSINKEVVAEFSNNRPLISGEAYFNVTINENNTYYVGVTDPDGDSYTIFVVGDLPLGSEFNNKTGVFTWMPTNSDQVNVTFAAMDSRGGISASLTPTISFCDCSGHGNCLFTTPVDGQIRYATFRTVQCLCDTGYAGQTCGEDSDGCRNRPCLIGTDCFDLTPEEEVRLGKAFNCSECPTGYFEDLTDFNCIDIDECNSTTLGYDACDQICRNTPGSFECVCKTGYIINENSTCTDIDECSDGIAGCQQECTNIDGGYECSCYYGFELNADNHTCNQAGDLCVDLGCAYGCTNSTEGGDLECFCPSGYQIVNDTECEDVNECEDSVLNKCQHTNRCTNTDGSYDCACDDGYTLASDGRRCDPCPAGSWGAGCLEVCNCKDSTTTCDVSTGCAECRDGLQGGACAEDVNECLASPCGTGASCNNTFGSFICICDVGYQSIDGRNCVEIDECASDPCQNNGVCNDLLNGYNCTCDSGYTGTHCETDIDECASNPCLNGGTCLDRVNKFRCICTGNWTGETCERSVIVDPTPTPTPTPLCELFPIVHNTTRRVKYEGQIIIETLPFNDAYADIESDEYNGLKNIVQPEIDRIYQCSPTFRQIFVLTTDYLFQRSVDGHIIVNFEAQFIDSINTTAAEEELSVGEFSFGLDTAAISVAQEALAMSNWILIVIIICVLLGIICFVLLGLLVNNNCRKSERTSDWSDASSETRHFTFPKPGLLVWQDSESLSRISGTPEMRRVTDEQRLRPIHRAITQAPNVDWSLMRQFAQRQYREPKRQVSSDMLHRGPIPSIYESPEPGPSGVGRMQRYNLTPTHSPRMPRSQFQLGPGGFRQAPFGAGISGNWSPRLTLPTFQRPGPSFLPDSPETSPTGQPKSWAWAVQDD